MTSRSTQKWKLEKDLEALELHIQELHNSDMHEGEKRGEINNLNKIKEQYVEALKRFV